MRHNSLNYLQINVQLKISDFSYTLIQASQPETMQFSLSLHKKTSYNKIFYIQRA